MNIQVIQVPYDSGHESLRTGRGPDYFLQRGMSQLLESEGHSVEVHRLESKETFRADIETTFELDRLLADQVNAAISKDAFPFVLSGACHSCVGLLAGLGSESVGMIWFDSHGDFNTPETTISGMLDGMGVAMATGRCWRALLKTIPGFRPILEERVVHIGARDLDPEEEINLKGSNIRLVLPNEDTDFMRETLNTALDNLAKSVDQLYLHIDLDVLDTGEALVNHADTPGGMSLDLVLEFLRTIKKKFTIRAGAIGSFDPDYDRNDIVLHAGFEIVRALTDTGGTS